MSTMTRNYSPSELDLVKSFFTDSEWETISCALEDYINYDDPDAHPSDLSGGISVSDRVNSIDKKLNQLYVNTQGRDI